MRLRSYAGCNALVTGASSGIGRLLAQRLAREGAAVALVARRAEALDALATEIEAAGARALPLVCDVGDPVQVERAAERALSELGPVDILVNNAGYGGHRRFLDWKVSDVERLMRVNYLGAVYFSKALLPAMVERGRGWLVFLASVAGRLGVPEESAYAASKFALVGLAEALSLELEEAGIHVLTVCPGSVRTPFFSRETLGALPESARRSMVEPEALVERIFEALAIGAHELTFPRYIRFAYAARALLPRWTRGQIRRHTLGASRRPQSPSSGT